jgi:hypothetical protein
MHAETRGFQRLFEKRQGAALVGCYGRALHKRAGQRDWIGGHF